VFCIIVRQPGLKKNIGLRVLENRVLRKLLGQKWEEATGNWTK
jgi:hypothetical protein